jgi:hypothetical protein
MTEKKQPDLNLLDCAFVGMILIAIFLLVWNIVQTQQVKSVAEYNKEHVCFLTDVIYGPVPPATMEEMCDVLREDLHEEWQVQSR